MFRSTFTMAAVAVSLLLGATSADAHLVPKITIKKPEITIKKPEITIKKPEITIKKPEITIKKPEITIKKPTIKVEKPTIKVEKPTINMGNSGKNIEQTVAKASDDVEKIGKNIGKAVEKGAIDGYREVTRKRESDGSANMDFTDQTPGPVLGTHYRLEVENGTTVAVFLRTCMLTVVESKDGKVVGMNPITGNPGDRIVLKSNQGINMQW